MDHYDLHERPTPGPFGMGWQGWLIITIVILVTALFAATRSDWQSMVFAALVPPLILFPLITLLSRRLQYGVRTRAGRLGPADDFHLVTFLARTNPIMFLLFGPLTRRSDEDRFQQLLRSGPYGMGQKGYLVAFIVLLAPLILTVIIIALTGQPLAHSGGHFP